jgi:hypothetical protein
MCNSRKQGDGERVEIELLQNVADQIGLFSPLVDGIEDVLRSPH